MQIVTDILQYDKKPCAATIGSFDGVHMGHAAMLGELRAAASEKGLPLMVVTFARHPRMLFNDACAPFLLTPAAIKLQQQKIFSYSFSSIIRCRNIAARQMYMRLM